MLTLTELCCHAADAVEARVKAEKRARLAAAKLRRQKVLRNPKGVLFMVTLQAEQMKQEEAEFQARFKKRDERLAK